MNADYTSKLNEFLSILVSMPDAARRMELMRYSRDSKNVAPAEGESFDYSCNRLDDGCSDSVGVYVRVVDGGVKLRVLFGGNTQTLTRALGHIFCVALDGQPVEALAAIPEDTSAKLIGIPATHHQAGPLGLRT